MFASRITREIKIEKETVTIRALSGRSKEQAQQATLGRAAELLARVGGASVMAEIQKLGGEKAVRGDEAERDPRAAFDRQCVLVKGIVRWTADEPLNDDTIGDLEAPVSDLLFREILDLSRVALTPEDVKKQGKRRKNA